MEKTIMTTYSLNFDIGARRSGKTYRLIKNVIRHICKESSWMGGEGMPTSTNYNNKAIIVTSNRESAKSIKNRLEPFINLFPDQIEILIIANKDQLRGKSGKRFYDEYKLCQYVEWRNGDYYSGTEE